MKEDVLEIGVPSTLDGSLEQSLFLLPANGVSPVPLIVALHEWSHDRFSHEKHMPLCRDRGWAMLVPEFRGSNLTSNPRARQACGSRLARQDIIDAVAHVLARFPVDPARVVLFGASGGGHMALLTAAFAPERWYHVDAWCPITDLAAWHGLVRPDGTRNGYAPHLEHCMGGAPGDSDALRRDYAERSPLHHVPEFMRVRSLMLHHGKQDVVVPYSQSVALYDALEARRHPNLYLELFAGGHGVYAREAFNRFDALLR